MIIALFSLKPIFKFSTDVFWNFIAEQLEKERIAQSEGYKTYLNFQHHFGDASPLEVKEILHTYRETFRTLREKLVTNGYSIPELLEYLTDRDKEHLRLECKIP